MEEHSLQYRRNKLIKIAGIFAVIGVINFWLAAISVEHFKLFGVLASLFSVTGYFSLLLHSYRSRGVIHERDGSKVSLTTNPFLYRFQYFIFACFGLIVLMVLLPYFLQ